MITEQDKKTMEEKMAIAAQQVATMSELEKRGMEFAIQRVGSRYGLMVKADKDSAWKWLMEDDRDFIKLTRTSTQIKSIAFRIFTGEITDYRLGEWKDDE